MISGVYMIKNILNNKCYIGSSYHINKRKRVHFKSLAKGSHHSQILQRAYNKYGESNFSFEILFTCPKEFNLKLEQIFIEELKPEYNICEIAGSPLGRKISEETRRRISKSLIGNKRNSGNKASEKTKIKMSLNNKGKKRIIQYSLEMNILKEWDSISQISKELNIQKSGISKCCSGKIRNIRWV